MSKRGNAYGAENRVNILKKVKVRKTWNLYPAVVEPNGKLRDEVLVRGKVEVHPEGHYYIEWWQDGRKREQVKDRAEVVDRSRRKAIELEANRAGIETVQENANDSGGTLAEAVASLPERHRAAAARTEDLRSLQTLFGILRQQLCEALRSRRKA